MTEGGGTRRPLETPARTASSHNTATPTGSTSPAASRSRRARGGRCAVETVGSAETVIPPTDMAWHRIATRGDSDDGGQRTDDGWSTVFLICPPPSVVRRLGR